MASLSITFPVKCAVVWNCTRDCLSVSPTTGKRFKCYTLWISVFFYYAYLLCVCDHTYLPACTCHGTYVTSEDSSAAAVLSSCGSWELNWGPGASAFTSRSISLGPDLVFLCAKLSWLLLLLSVFLGKRKQYRKSPILGQESYLDFQCVSYIPTF